MGDVSDNRSARQRFESFVTRGLGPCWLWMGGVTHNGYGRFKFEGKTRRAHRYSFVQHRGEIPRGYDVLHSCDTPSCVNPDHLFLGTHQDNMIDRSAKGRQSRGERNGSSKLTADQVAKIRSRYVRGRGGGSFALAREYGITRTHLGFIVNRKNWKDLP